jgi:HEAT repeats
MVKARHRRRRRPGAAVGVALVVLACSAGLVLRRRHRAPSAPVATAPVPKGDPWHDFPAGTFVTRPLGPVDAGPPKPDWFSTHVTPDQVSSAMKEWREGIIEKRQDAVLNLDQAFAMLPGLYGPPLVKVAETDADERVRAFSTRVLGKMKNPELVEDFQRLLADKSPFVRQNAAWALGELAKRPRGRDMAQGAVDDLRQVAGDDHATEVRVAAANALKALQ